MEKINNFQGQIQDFSLEERQAEPQKNPNEIKKSSVPTGWGGGGGAGSTIDFQSVVFDTEFE